MRDGADRTDVEYVWPETLLLPDRPPKLVYLDLNHWIALAKAQAGHADGRRFADVLALCVRAVESQAAVFPISDTIYGEINKIGQHRQRRHLREVIETVSRFKVVTSRSVVSVHEIEALLDSLIGPNPTPINTMDYLDWGVLRAFGMVDGIRVRTKGGADITADVRAAHPGGPSTFDRIVAEAELKLNRSVIEGPAPDEEAELRSLGWNPAGAFPVMERRAQQELEQVARFDQNPEWRRGRIRDVVAARELLIEINEHLFRSLRERQASLEDICPTIEATRRAFDSMPSFDVAVTLKTAYHRDARHRWTPNDIHDIDALGSTLPYCDIVVTDKAVVATASQSGLSDRLSTTALARLDDLAQHLS
jgi:hypothetical protein